MNTSVSITRRGALAAATGAGLTLTQTAQAGKLKEGPFWPDWQSLQDNYRTPAWYSDLKFGIWAHWGPQCIPEQGDWYGRQMYQQGNWVYDYHLKTYGHPSKFGFMDLLPTWQVPDFDAQRLLTLYKDVGAGFFVAMACHHDNFDMFNSKYHPWNVANIGPRRDFMKEWKAAAQAVGLRFGVSNHASHAWHWWQTAYGYDPEGPLAGVRYDAYTRSRDMGKGQWWDGLDPQGLYCGPRADLTPPDGIGSIKAMNDFHDKHSGQWLEIIPPNDPYYVKLWLARQINLVETYDPDFVFFDDTKIPFDAYGLAAVSHFYNHNLKTRGKLEAVLTANWLSEDEERGVTLNVERGSSDRIRARPWQTCTCIGSWHYSRGHYTNNTYKTAKDVVVRLVDTVSKNGTLLLSVPVRAAGYIDDKEETVVREIGAWMKRNSEAIVGTRPWKLYGEGPTQFGQSSSNEDIFSKLGAADIRFTTKAGNLYVLPLGWPDETLTVRSLRISDGRIHKVELLGSDADIPFSQNNERTVINIPSNRDGILPVFKIYGNFSA